MNTKVKELDQVRLKARPEIVFGVRKIQRLSRKKGLFIWGQYDGGTHIIAYNDVELVRKGPRHNKKEQRHG